MLNRKSILRTPIYPSLLWARSKKESLQLQFGQKNEHTRAYCISPYKTGTTFLANSFLNGNKVAHEPMHYTTLTRLDDEEFLHNRSLYLSLDLENSGCFATSYKTIKNYNPDAKFISIFRDFSSWSESMINYFSLLNNKLYCNYIPRLFLDRYTRYPVDEFFSLSYKKRVVVAEGLAQLWIDSYNFPNDENLLVIEIKSIESRIKDIESFLGLKSTITKKTWKRKNKEKTDINVCDYLSNYYLKRINFISNSIDR